MLKDIVKAYVIARSEATKQSIKLLSLLAIVCALLVIKGVAHADVFSSEDLIKDAKKWDGHKVVYNGEAVTAIMSRGKYAWVNLNDGTNAIGVWIKSSLAGEIKNLGDYKNKGDIVEVVGRFHRACPMHGGDLDIHAHKISIIKRGGPVAETLDTRRNIVSAVLFLLTIASVLTFRKRT
jgi:hypothetical protein